MPNHPKFKGKKIEDQEHNRTVAKMGKYWRDFLEPIFLEHKLCTRGRIHPSPPNTICIYIFRCQFLHDHNDDMRGLFMHSQIIRGKAGAQIVFRRIQKFEPLPEEQWKKLSRDTWQPQEERWRAYDIYSLEDLLKASALVGTAIDRYDIHYGLIDEKLRDTD
ncbi:MAG: hypothetical protein SGI97_02550 [candidate division Zixibacteria bacterium]|nr:hypothetical protein [candidate division Zixibacteria bacterium]